MSHNIFGNRFYGHREPAWHGLGTVMQDNRTPLEALRMIDGDFEIAKCPEKIEVQTLFGTQLLEDPGRYAIVRVPTEDSKSFAVLGHCGGDYEIIQRADFAKALEKLSSRWPLETIGILGSGEDVFFSLDAGTIEIAGEEIHQFFLVHDRVDGKTSSKIAFTPVRVVCQNTLVTGMKQATMTAALDHRTGLGQDFQFRLDLIDKMAEAQRITVNTLEMLAKVSLDREQVEQVLAYTYPYPPVPAKMSLLDAIAEDDTELADLRAQGSKAESTYQYYVKRAETFREGARELFGKFGDEQPQLGNTAWALYNAVVESADFRQGEESVNFSTLWGPRAQEKTRAFSAVMKYVK